MPHHSAIFLGIVGAAVLLAPLYLRRLGDCLVVVAGADRKELGKWGVDRTYFVGLGMALILTATVSAAALTAAATVVFHLKPLSVPSLAVMVTWFLLILSLDRWFVSDQKFGFAPSSTKALGIGAKWMLHFLAELMKITPRIVLGLLGAWLFANFLLLIVFGNEIQEQMKSMDTQRAAQFQQQVAAQAREDASAAQATLLQAQAEEAAVQTDYNAGAAAIQQADQTLQKGMAAEAANGVKCGWVTSYYRQYDATNHYRVLSRETYVCPQEIKNLQAAHDAVVTRYSATAKQEQDKINKIESQYQVPDLKRIIHDAPDVAKQKLAADAPTDRDGLMVRIQALDLLTTKPQGTCPAQADQAALATNPACVSRYSARATEIQGDIRWWLVAIEIAPVVLKFIAAVMPRGGYAWIMAARDDEAKAEALTTMSVADSKMRAAIARALRIERVRIELEAALQEKEMRKLGQEEQRWNVGRMRRMLSSRVVLPPNRDREITVPDHIEVLEGVIAEPANGHEPVNAARRVIKDEDFLR